jgi:hypothetical protein
MSVRAHILFLFWTGFLYGWAPGRATAQSTDRDRWVPTFGLLVTTPLEGNHSTWGVGGSAALFRQTGRFRLGLELAYQGLGTETTVIENFNNEPGAVLREDFRRSWLRVAGLARLDLGSKAVRPFLVAGVGAYDGRFHDRIEVRNANGERVPFYDFEGSGSDVKPGLTAGLGLELARLRGGLGLGLEARWHGILDIGEDGLVTADFLSLGLALTW